MYIPIFWGNFNDREPKFNYKNYPFAPKTTEKSKNLGALTSWFMLIVWGGLFWCAVISILRYFFGRNDSVQNGIALILLIPAYFCLRKFKISYQSKLDEEAEKEAAENMSLSSEAFEAKLTEQKKLREKKDLRFVGFFLMLFSAPIIYFCIAEFFKKPIDVMTISGKDFAANSQYYIEELYVIDSYAQVKEGSRTFYLAMFKDKEGKLFFTSFDPFIGSEAKKIIDKHITEKSEENGLCKLSVYVKTKKVTQDKKSKHETVFVGRERYYDNAVQFYKQYFNAEDTNVHAEYVCMKGENFVFNSLGWSGIIIILVSSALFLLGLRLLIRK